MKYVSIMKHKYVPIIGTHIPGSQMLMINAAENGIGDIGLADTFL
jgi:anionic cell wall polymer biosynthesis LytR-Cps2A-Psr (LCP) family protein